MQTIKTLLLAGLFFVGTPGMANAQVFNSKVANPFAFCSAPKPCKHCHPWRTIYEEICANKINPKDTTEKYEQSTGTESVETVYPRFKDVSVNGEKTVEGLDVIKDQSGGRPVEGLEINNNPIREVQ